MDVEWTRAEVAAQARNDPRILDYFQNPNGSEMWSRWDMQEAPPDILITNYSMLNIMLMRGVEAPIFDATRLWIAASPNNIFHLVVDELHSYRGTPGTEVPYLLRVLLDRIGLKADSEQLRIIASSASLESGATGLRYLEEFHFSLVRKALREHAATRQRQQSAGYSGYTVTSGLGINLHRLPLHVTSTSETNFGPDFRSMPVTAPIWDGGFVIVTNTGMYRLQLHLCNQKSYRHVLQA
jgi:ATP-dependent helicase YprA (DUF1998 family)